MFESYRHRLTRIADRLADVELLPDPADVEATVQAMDAMTKPDPPEESDGISLDS